MTHTHRSPNSSEPGRSRLSWRRPRPSAYRPFWLSNCQSNRMTPRDLHTLIEQHHVSYEVSPYYVLLDLRNNGRPAVKHRVHAGFDVDLYATGIGRELRLSEGDEQMRLTLDDLQQVARTVLPNPSDGCKIEIMPFESTLILDTRNHLQPEAMLKIRITHSRGLDHPAGPVEERTLRDVEEQLRALGAKAGTAASDT
jgi:hypothetical protein